MKKKFLVFWMYVLSSGYAYSQSANMENVYYKQYGAICDIFVKSSSDDYSAYPTDDVSEVVIFEPSITYQIAQCIENTDLERIYWRISLAKNDSTSDCSIEMRDIVLYKKINDRRVTIENTTIKRQVENIFRDVKAKTLYSRYSEPYFTFGMIVFNLKVKK